MGTGALGAPHNGTQIVGIAQLVADDDQRVLAPGGGLLQNVIDGEIVVGGSQGNHPLMGAGEGHLIQLAPVNRHDDGTGFLCLGSKPLQSTVGITIGDEDLVDGASGPECLGQGIAALKLVLILFGCLHGLRAAVTVPVGTVEILFTVFLRSHCVHPSSGKGHTIHNILLIVTDFLPLHNCYFLRTLENWPFLADIYRKFIVKYRIIHCSRKKNVI